MRPDARPVAGLVAVVLGGTGFLGGHIGTALTELGARVHPVSRTGGMDLVTTPPEEFAAFLGAVGAEVVVNAAGRAWRSDEAEMAAGNADLVERLTRALAMLPGTAVRLVQLGSVHEYGAGTPNASTTEDHVPAPVGAYGRTKLAGTQAVLRAASGQGIDGVVLRLANVLGAGTPDHSLFGRMAAQLGAAVRAREGGRPPAALRTPPLQAVRDVVDVRDAVAAVLAAATAPAAAVSGQVINVGRGEPVLMRGLIHRMVELSDVAVQVTEDPGGPVGRVDVTWQLLDIARAERLLGWRPRRSLDDSLRDLLAPVLPPAHPPPGGSTDAL
ncbi:NAD(P)-dependent oxidoreductase [Streptomyces sp. NPDC048664]|uniref:NAD-dependent epimerase/dehydratase family protein n=1 Tax=Streptomyces sp. NPDC048664 TaxID=3154505 RepID=UPI003438A35B